jgi:hypothetical protein
LLEREQLPHRHPVTLCAAPSLRHAARPKNVLEVSIFAVPSTLKSTLVPIRGQLSVRRLAATCQCSESSRPLKRIRDHSGKCSQSGSFAHPESTPFISPAPPLFVLPYRAQTTMDQSRSGSAAIQDAFTVGAIAILAYMLGNMLHEGLGHGGACLVTGGEPLVLSSVHFECSNDTLLVDAGGTLINLLAGVLFFLLGRLTSSGYPRLKYFFWIAMTINLYSGTGYFLFSGIGGIGDWAAFIQGFSHQWLWRIALTILGAVTYYLAARLSLLELRPLIGSDKEERYRSARRLTSIPYFAGGILMCIAGAFNPKGAILILISAAASTFGGTSGLLWATPWLNRGTVIPYGPPREPLPLPKSWPLIVAACVIAIAFIAILGPSVRFAH